MALPATFRVPLLFLGMLALLSGVLGGLVRLGWPAPAPAAAAGWHGALMISAFFGTVISLERAVALGRTWTYLAPALAGLGGLALATAAPTAAALSLLTAAATVLAVASAWVVKRQPAAFTFVLALGALCWLTGNAFWLAGGDGLAAVPAWLGFLVLTIAGERLELTRFLPTPAMARRLFLAIVAALLLGIALSLGGKESGLKLFSASLLALAAWLARYDIARRNVRETGLTRFIAVCLLGGYAWLAAAALLGLAGGLQPGHAWRDATLHALALGFVFSMVLGHAPIVFPSVVRIRIPFHPAMYLPLAALHLTLAARLAGGLAGSPAVQQYGALGNALALLLFILTMVGCAVRGRKTAS